jgi:hypothetical protein
MLFVCSLFAAATFLADDAPALIRSGYSGIHECTLPNCLNTTELVSGTAGKAPYSKDVVVDEKRGRIYWFEILRQGSGNHIGAADLHTGAPIPGSGGSSPWSWIERPAQDIALAFDANAGVLYILDKTKTLLYVDCDTKKITPLITFPSGQSPYNLMYHQHSFYYGVSFGIGRSTTCLARLDLPLLTFHNLSCSVDDSHMPQQPSNIALSTNEILLNDANYYTASAYSYSGTFMRTVDLTNIGSNLFVYGMIADTRTNTLYICGSNRSQDYTVTISKVDLTTFAGKPLHSYGQDTCMGMALVGVKGPPAPPSPSPDFPILKAISPTHGSRGGGTSVTATGSGFKKGRKLACRFGGAGGVVVSAQYKRGGASVKCNSPPSAISGPAQFQVSNDGTSYSFPPLEFTYD